MTKPTILERLQDRICPECGVKVERKSPKGRRPKFCCPEHAKAYNNRLLQEGAAIVAHVKAWRVDRGSGEIAQKAMQEMCRIADGFNARDREEGRCRADYYAATLIWDGQYMDRMRA